MKLPMSIRLLAKDLYKAEQNVDQLQKKIDTAGVAEKAPLMTEIEIARQERDILRKMLDGEKASGTFRKRFDGFGAS